MKKLKLFLLSTALLGLSIIGIIQISSSDANAQSSVEDYCQWNGKDCLSPSVDNYCICESGSGDQ